MTLQAYHAVVEALREARNWFDDVHKYDESTPEWYKAAQQALAHAEQQP